MSDPLGALRGLHDLDEPDGVTAARLANHCDRSTDDVLVDLARYLHDRLVVTERDGIGTVRYTLTDAGRVTLLVHQDFDREYAGEQLAEAQVVYRPPVWAHWPDFPPAS